jgi:hypothetical protein
LRDPLRPKSGCGRRVGSRGYGAIRRVVLGGVSFRVLRDAQCPVIVLPLASVAAAADDAPVGSAAADAD